MHSAVLLLYRRSVFDNALDMAHIHYLHSDSFGNQGKPVIQDMKTVGELNLLFVVDMQTVRKFITTSAAVH